MAGRTRAEEVCARRLVSSQNSDRLESRQPAALARLRLLVTAQMPDYGVIFSDGIEKDYLEFNSGAQAEVMVAKREGKLVN